MSEVACPDCGHLNRADAHSCAACGEFVDGADRTTDHAVIDLGDAPGTVAVDRSAFGPHEGLFVVVQGPKAGARYALDADLVSVGRHPRSDIFLNDVTVSRRHAAVTRQGARYWIEDSGSLNGVYLNRQLVDQAELSEGDEVQIGKFKLVFAHGTAKR